MRAKPSLRPARLPKPAPRQEATKVIRTFVRTLERIEGAKRPRGRRDERFLNVSSPALCR